MASAPHRDVLPLEARGLTVRLGQREIIRSVSFRLEPGRRTVILGPNGAGKTTLLRALHGLVPSSGSIAWNGGPRDRRVEAMVFQHPVMLRRSALANVEYALAIQGVRGAGRRTRAEEALARVGLSAIGSRPARVLSGGEQQRVALARAWATRPRVVFLDEPTASLDPAAAAEVERVMGEMQAAGTAVVFTTHHLGLARRAASEILFLDRGRITERTAADRFFTQPASPQAAAYLEGELP